MKPAAGLAEAEPAPRSKSGACGRAQSGRGDRADSAAIPDSQERTEALGTAPTSCPEASGRARRVSGKVSRSEAFLAWLMARGAVLRLNGEGKLRIGHHECLCPWEKELILECITELTSAQRKWDAELTGNPDGQGDSSATRSNRVWRAFPLGWLGRLLEQGGFRARLSPDGIIAAVLSVGDAPPRAVEEARRRRWSGETRQRWQEWASEPEEETE